MPIVGVKQVDFIKVDDKIRLRKFNQDFACALDWYQDKETLLLVDGIDQAYDMEKLARMYKYLDQHGELYWIEIKEDDSYVPIGDVTFSKDDLPIVIGEKKYRGQGIASKVVKALIERARFLGYRTLRVREIYSDNLASQKMFEKCGFKQVKRTQKGYSYQLEIVFNE